MKFKSSHNEKYLCDFKHINEFDYEKNLGLSPEKIAYKSSKKVWWICRYGHSYESRVYSRTNGNGCSYCSGKKVCEDNCLAEHYPHLVNEWSEKNKKSPLEYTKMSNKIVWWKCDKNHEWDASINNRTSGNQGCPFCSGKRVCDDNCLANVNPELAKQWSDKNNITTFEVTECSGKKVWWVCDSGHEWEATVANRTNGFGCPSCSGNVVSVNNSLVLNHPQIAKEYDKIKNDILLETISFGSNKKVWWVCPNGHSYDALVRSRTFGNGCPYCSKHMSKPSQKWLDGLGILMENREVVIKISGRIFKVDGFDPITNTIYEFYGDFWHGNPKKYKRENLNKVSNKTFGELYDLTIERRNFLVLNKYNFVSMWESDFYELNSL